jgi:hypothetical protein
MGVMEKIKEIEAEMARTQKNKATSYHLGRLLIFMSPLSVSPAEFVCFPLCFSLEMYYYMIILIEQLLLKSFILK